MKKNKLKDIDLDIIMGKKYKLKYEIKDSEFSSVVYGDSITSDTPLLLRMPDTGMITIKRVEELGEYWENYPFFKLFDITISSPKEQSKTEYQIWTDSGWADIKRIIRHNTKKQIFKITTDTGSVKVTEDHSLLTTFGEQISPKMCEFGTPLLSSYTSEFTEIYTGLSSDNAYMCGVMFGDSTYDRVSDDILNSSEDLVICFLNGFNSIEPRKMSDLEIAGLYFLYKKIGKIPRIFDLRCRLTTIIESSFSSSKIKKINKVEYSGDYVYDIETSTGRFQAGIGELIVKNTDSCMVELNTKALIKYKKVIQEYKDIIKLTKEEESTLEDLKTNALEEAFEQGKILAKEITIALFKHPINLEFEKVYSPFIILSKKRYMGCYYGESPYKIDKIEKKGVVLTRRDNPDIVKKVYQGIMDPLLLHGERGIQIGLDFLKKNVKMVLNGEVDSQDLIITKALAKGYGKVSKNGEIVMGEGDYVNVNSPHVTLANKMRERDIGSAPLVGDRITYVFVNIPENPSAKLYEKAEQLSVVEEKCLDIDYVYYVKNQLKNPCCEILKPMIPDIDKIFDKFLAPSIIAKKKEVAEAKIKAKIPKGQRSILSWVRPSRT